MATVLVPLTHRDRRLEALLRHSRLSSARGSLRSPSSAEDGTARAMEFYDAELRSNLEPRLNGQYVAIHPDTQEYEVARGPGKAFRALRAKQPEGQIVLHHIGPAPSGLKARLRGEQPQ